MKRASTILSAAVLLVGGAWVTNRAVVSCTPEPSPQPPYDWQAERGTPAERLADLEREKAAAVARDARHPGEPPEWTAYRDALAGRGAGNGERSESATVTG